MDEIGESLKWDGGHGKCLENLRVSLLSIYIKVAELFDESSARKTIRILVYTEHLFTKNADNVD